ncbi:MAG TPA: ABC transporter permease [Alphaproteobacteria bacterium]|nr:ABC transporter permease [Alphaproteobacteria bacterium]
MSGAPQVALPRWIDIGLLPIINLVQALLVSGLVVLVIGADPLQAVRIMAVGAVGDGVAISYTLYYATDFIFTGLAVAVAFHAGLFNIGGEGQAYLAGLGATLLVLALDQYLPGIVVIPLALVAAIVFGAAWAFVPAYLQAYRGSHIVITTIMFNFIGAALMVYIASDVLRPPGEMLPSSREFASSAFLPPVHEVLGLIGLQMPSTPLNLSILWAAACCVFVWVFIWRTRWGYAIRAVGLSPKAAVYAGISPQRVVLMAMCLSGGLAAGVAFNQLIGYHHKLLLDFVAGAGFTGIAVALMGRNHPIGIVLSALLFGALHQGGAELAFEIPTINRDMIVAMQGLVILFSGALAYMNRPWIARLYVALARRPLAAEAA